MSVAEMDDYWTARLQGNNPASPVGDSNTAWTRTSGVGGDGSANTGGFWRIVSSGGGQIWRQTVADGDNNLTLVCAIKFASAPTANTMIMALDNGSHRIEVQSNGDLQKVKLVGASTVTSDDLDIGMAEDNPIPLILRLTLANDGTARLYMREIIEDDDATQHYLSVTGSSSSAQGAFFGTTNGTVDFYTSYFTPNGSFDPDEMDLSDFVTHTLLQTGMNIVATLKDSNKLLLKSHVTSDGIVYGYDLSSKALINRLQSPSVHVFMQRAESPDFLTLAGARTDQRFEIIILITTRGTDYKNAYRLGISIMGEVFDELYLKTGLKGGVDSIISYNAEFDSKIDEDEVVCVHTLRITYMKKIRMFQREA